MTVAKMASKTIANRNENNIIKLLNNIANKKRTAVKKQTSSIPAHKELKALSSTNFDWVTSDQIEIHDEIWQRIATMKNKILKNFISAVFEDGQIMHKFYTAKASANYHHNNKGELLKHSYEVAITAMDLAEYYGLDATTKEATFISGLIHDIGKIKMFYNDARSGINTEHESLGFMVLGKHLEVLQSSSSNLFEAITNCMAAKKYALKNAFYVIEGLVRCADQISAVVDNFNQTFTGKPTHYFYTKGVHGKIYKRL